MDYFGFLNELKSEKLAEDDISADTTAPEAPHLTVKEARSRQQNPSSAGISSPRVLPLASRSLPENLMSTAPAVEDTHLAPLAPLGDGEAQVIESFLPLAPDAPFTVITAPPKTNLQSVDRSASECTVVVDPQLNPARDGSVWPTAARLGAALQDRMVELLRAMAAKLPKEASLLACGTPSQEPALYGGRVVADNEARFDATSILLEDLDGTRVRLALQCPCSLFPGQVVLVEGSNPGGDQILARRVIEGAPLEHWKAPEIPAPRGLLVLVAHGPFTDARDLKYAPLGRLLAYTERCKPDVVILMGPFLDASNACLPKLLGGEGEGEGEQRQPERTPSEVFESVLAPIRRQARAERKFVLAPSPHDLVGTVPVVPQAPLLLAGEETGNVILCPNPATIAVEGISFGMISGDPVAHINASHVSITPPGVRADVFATLCRHIIAQRSYYPLFPPRAHKHGAAPGDPPPLGAYGVDATQGHALSLQVAPDILLAPSGVARFIREADGCICVNPKFGGGCFAQIAVSPPLTPDQPLRSRVRIDLCRC